MSEGYAGHVAGPGDPYPNGGAPSVGRRHMSDLTCYHAMDNDSECGCYLEAKARIEELEAGIIAVAEELLPAMENGQSLLDGYSLLRNLVEPLVEARRALGEE